MTLNLYTEILTNYEEIMNETNLTIISEKLDACLENVAYLFEIESDSIFYPILQCIQHGLMKQKYNLGAGNVDAVLISNTYLQLSTRSFQFSNNFQGTSAIENDNSRQKSEERTLAEVVPQINGFHEIVGYQEIKNLIHTYFILPLHQPQLFSGHVSVINSVLLFGPPGTGKTRIAHALASELACKLYCVSPSDILSEYIGQTEKAMKAIFKQIREAPTKTILFIDEIDGICRKRNQEEQEFSRRLKTELMCQLNDLYTLKNAILLCATNCPWDLDTAFIRRFQKRIYVPLPERMDRFELLQYYTNDTPLEMTKNNWGPILTRTEGYSASDLANVVQYALSMPLTELVNNKKWILNNSNEYQPASEEEQSNIFYCDIGEMPKNSVTARNVNINDLEEAIGQVKRTVSEAEEEKYKQYATNF